MAPLAGLTSKLHSKQNNLLGRSCTYPMMHLSYLIDHQGILTQAQCHKLCCSWRTECIPVTEIYVWIQRCRKEIAHTSGAAQWALESRCDKNEGYHHLRGSCSLEKAKVKFVSLNVLQRWSDSTERTAAWMSASHLLKINSNLSVAATKHIWTTDFTKKSWFQMIRFYAGFRLVKIKGQRVIWS